MLGGHNIARRSERGVGSDQDSMLLTVVNEGVSLEVRLGLELVHCNRLLCNLLYSFHIFNLVV